MGRVYIDSCNDAALRFPNGINRESKNKTTTKKNKQKKHLPRMGDHYSAHAGVGNRFQAAAVEIKDILICSKTQKRPLLYMNSQTQFNVSIEA